MLLQLTATVSPGQALTAKPGQTPLKSRTKGRGPLRLGKTWRTASTPTPNRFHGHAPFQPRRANKPATRALRKNEREGRAERRPQCRALPGCHLPSPPRLPGASGAAAEPPPRASSPSRCHAALQQGKAGSPASLETPTPSEKPAGETDGELLGCEGTRLRNGGAEGRLPSNRPGGCGTRAAAWQTAQRSAAQRRGSAAAAARGLRRLARENPLRADCFFQKESFPCLLQQDLITREKQGEGGKEQAKALGS